VRTRLFRSFLLIILIALLSSLVFQRLIVRDFDLYVESVQEDQLGWVVASVESSYAHNRWDLKKLTESLHWAMMLGIDASVMDAAGREILTSRKVIESLAEPMAKHMASLFHLDSQGGAYAERPLVAEERKVGELFYRPFPKQELKEREKAFKGKTRYFLYVSLAIAGAGALFAALLLTRHLSRPLLRMKEAAHRIANGDLSARIQVPDRPSRRGAGGGEVEPDEIVSLAQSFNFMADSLQQEEALRKDLFSNIGHELRTPLTIMKAHLEALEDGILKDPGATVGTIKMEAEKLIELVRGIEDLTLAQAAFLKPGEPTPIHLKEFFAGLLSDLSPIMKEKNLAAEWVQDTDLVVAVDVDKLEKIVRNLLSNAIKFTPQGGRIRIDYGEDEETFFLVVNDTGIGISEEQLPRIFDRFYRVEKSGPAGLGLGLAITKELVGALGGRIEVESRPGEGTAFRVCLPRNLPLRSS
jgi:two-component system, OmpR family, sensor histidine kinase BaeS